MKKTLIASILSMCVVGAFGKTFLDKTNTSQLNYRVLDSGQVAWNEEDGSAVVYVGSPSEVKNLRVVDPTALRGFRRKIITDELTFNASAGTTKNTDGSFRYTYHPNTAVYEYEYIAVDPRQDGYVYNGTTWDNGPQWGEGIYVQGNNGTYVSAGLTVGQTFATKDDPVTYYYKHKYVKVTIDIISKDTNIEAVDYTYSQYQGGFGDMDPMGATRTITYNGRRATIEIHIDYGHDSVYVEVRDISAACTGIGDNIMVNDLKTNNIYIKDRLSYESNSSGKGPGAKKRTAEQEILANSFNLYELRYWAKHLYDGNRGHHWANYPATNNVNMKSHFVMWNSGTTAIGGSAEGMQFISNSRTFMQFADVGTNDVVGTPYEGVQIAITDISQVHDDSDPDYGCWTIDVAIDVPAGKTAPSLNMLEVTYAQKLDKPIIWIPIFARWDATDEFGTSYHVVIPQVYAEPTSGFFRVSATVNPLGNKLKIKAELQVVGSDGLMYKLTWPSGGGAVTATLVD